MKTLFYSVLLIVLTFVACQKAPLQPEPIYASKISSALLAPDVTVSFNPDESSPHEYVIAGTDQEETDVFTFSVSDNNNQYYLESISLKATAQKCHTARIGSSVGFFSNDGFASITNTTGIPDVPINITYNNIGENVHSGDTARVAVTSYTIRRLSDDNLFTYDVDVPARTRKLVASKLTAIHIHSPKDSTHLHSGWQRAAVLTFSADKAGAIKVLQIPLLYTGLYTDLTDALLKDRDGNTIPCTVSIRNIGGSFTIQLKNFSLDVKKGQTITVYLSLHITVTGTHSLASVAYGNADKFFWRDVREKKTFSTDNIDYLEEYPHYPHPGETATLTSGE